MAQAHGTARVKRTSVPLRSTHSVLSYRGALRYWPGSSVFVRRYRSFRKWARIFGSYAQGEATGASDIDVVVDKGASRYLAVCGFSEDLYRATGKLPDVYDISELTDGPFRETVLREANDENTLV